MGREEGESEACAIKSKNKNRNRNNPPFTFRGGTMAA